MADTIANIIASDSIKVRQRGQATVEYAIMLAMFFGIALILVLLMSVFTEYGWRMISLVSLDL